VLVYILPPSLAEMSRRLLARSQDSQEVIRERISRAKDELIQWETFDYVVLNEDFDRAYADLAHIYHAERRKAVRNLWIAPFVDELLTEELPEL
jgi:guanylate kinase